MYDYFVYSYFESEPLSFQKPIKCLNLPAWLGLHTIDTTTTIWKVYRVDTILILKAVEPDTAYTLNYTLLKRQLR